MWIKGEYHANFDTVESLSKGALGTAMTTESAALGQADMFSRLDWFRTLHTICAPRSRPLMVRSRADHSDMWLFLVYQSRTHLKSLTNWYSFRFAPVFTNALPEKTREMLVRGAAQRLKKRFSRLTFTPVSDRDNARILFERGFGSAGWLCITSAVSTSHFLQVRGRSFAEYWQSRPGALRSTITRKGRKAESEIKIFDRFDPAAWKIYQDIYAASWKPTEPSPDFLEAIAKDAAQRGALRLGIASIEGQPVATQFWTIEQGEALIHKLAHLPDQEQFSPGSLLSYAMFERAIDVDRVDSIDFGTGDDAYKREWMEESRALYTLEMFNLGKPQAWLPAIRASISHLLKRR